MEELTALISKGKVDGPHFEQIMMKLWRFILGEDCFSTDAPPIQCTMHAIPKKQSEKILEHMLVAAGPHGTSVGLNYINIAPSTYDE